MNINLDNCNYLNEPFPHCVIDNFFNKTIAEQLHNNILSLKLGDANRKFVNKKDKHQYNKFGFSNINSFPSSLKETFVYLNSKEFIKKLEKLTGINNIIYGIYELNGAGIHMIKNEGYLKMHTDFNIYSDRKLGKLDRRINLLIYMNKDWHNEYGGDLLMYNPLTDPKMKKVKQIKPLFNRAVIFNTTNRSVHGHPKPLCVPKDIYRKSIAVYYYTKNKNNVDFEGNSLHSTLWYKTPPHI
jgi:Rps23 Pro-64 3,4-dihydroxylase Tpa1-like proline 4-hydroxylase